MIVDTSAVLAILKMEPEATAFAQAIEATSTVRISAATWLELCIVADGYRNPAIRTRLDQILENPVIVIEPVTAEQAQIARQAYRDYGKGSGHPANLNYGDCFSYALARAKREPILFKGDDFIHTDLHNAVTK